MSEIIYTNKTHDIIISYNYDSYDDNCFSMDYRLKDGTELELARDQPLNTTDIDGNGDFEPYRLVLKGTAQKYHEAAIKAELEKARLNRTVTWISVEDRLPISGDILVYSGYYDRIFTRCSINSLDPDVTHWMELPDKPGEPDE